jgi:glycosyltransferase involved in cell wall biosynthesis
MQRTQKTMTIPQSPGETVQSPVEVVMSAAAVRNHGARAIISPGQVADLDLTIFVSCYNEQAYIVGTLETIHAALAEVGGIAYEIIVIDDCSRDRSAELVEEYIANHGDDRILLRRNRVNRGLAQNYLDAAFMGKGKYYRLICGDNAEPQDTMRAVFSELGQADMLIPYYISAEGKSLFRRSLSGAYSLLINGITKYRLHYYNGLAVHLRYNVMRWHPNTRGFGFQADIICMLLDEGFNYKEVPVRTIERKKGDSKALTFKNMLSVAHTILEITIRRISNRAYRRGRHQEQPADRKR